MNSVLKKFQCGFEKAYVGLMGWKHIPESENQLLYVDIKKYRGKKLELGQTLVEKGDIIAEMHIDNLRIHNIDNSMKAIIKSYQNEMENLLKACSDFDEFKDIKAVYGISVLHPILKFLGFTCFPIKNFIYRSYLKWWENMLRDSFSTGENQKNKKKNDPMVCWVSIEKLKTKYQLKSKED